MAVVCHSCTGAAKNQALPLNLALINDLLPADITIGADARAADYLLNRGHEPDIGHRQEPLIRDRAVRLHLREVMTRFLRRAGRGLLTDVKHGGDPDSPPGLGICERRGSLAVILYAQGPMPDRAIGGC